MVHFFFFNIHFLSVSEHLPGFALSPQGIKDLFCSFLHFHMCFFFCVWYISFWSPAWVSPLSVAGKSGFLSFCPWVAFPWRSVLKNCSAVCLRRLCLKPCVTAGVAEPSIVCTVPGATFYGWILCGTENEAAKGVPLFCFKTRTCSLSWRGAVCTPCSGKSPRYSRGRRNKGQF